MDHQFSRRQFLQCSGSFATGIASATIFGLAGQGQSAERVPKIKVAPNILQRLPRITNRKQNFYTSGRHLYHPNGTKVILRGVDLPLLDDWGFPGRDTLTELVKTGANAVRIQWYKDYGQSSRPAFSLTDLDNFLTKCRTNRIIPILYLGDVTCQSDPDLLNSRLMPWWTSAAVLAILRRHQNYSILNLANELGNYRWTNNPTAALENYKNAYKTAIAMMRQKNIQVPLAIDAPDCGTSIEAFIKIGQELINSDPARNLLFSGHAYWAAYEGIPYIQAAIDAHIPLFFGEIANKQDESVAGKTSYCYYDLDGLTANHPPQNGFTYQKLLTQLQQQEIGWLAWSWWKDGCEPRQMTSNGTFAGLTPYGKDIVNNPVYGLKATAKKVPL